MELNAVLINIFIKIVDHITTGNVKGGIRSNETTDNYHQTLQFPSALHRFGFVARNFTVLAHSFPAAEGGCFQ